jgi:hypothetical protein
MQISGQDVLLGIYAAPPKGSKSYKSLRIVESVFLFIREPGIANSRSEYRCVLVSGRIKTIFNLYVVLLRVYY